MYPVALVLFAGGGKKWIKVVFDGKFESSVPA